MLVIEVVSKSLISTDVGLIFTIPCIIITYIQVHASIFNRRRTHFNASHCHLSCRHNSCILSTNSFIAPHQLYPPAGTACALLLFQLHLQMSFCNAKCQSNVLKIAFYFTANANNRRQTTDVGRQPTKSYHQPANRRYVSYGERPTHPCDSGNELQWPCNLLQLAIVATASWSVRLVATTERGGGGLWWIHAHIWRHFRRVRRIHSVNINKII